MIVLIGASSQMQKKSHVPLIPLLVDPFNIILNVLITGVHVLFYCFIILLKLIKGINNFAICKAIGIISV